jgi:hypothetical protein
MKRKAQEEMVGFVLIIVIVAVILLVFLVFSLTNKNTELVENYEVESFLQATIQYTTNCSIGLRDLSVQELIGECYDNGFCEDSRDSCKVLEETLGAILQKSWKVGENSPKKGYKLLINAEGSEMLNMTQGICTKSSKGASQDFSKAGREYIITLTVYS